MALDLIAEQGEDPDDESRNEECHDKGTGKDERLLGTDTTLDKRLVDELTIVGSGRQGDAVLLTFLEEQHIERGLDILLATDLVEDTLLDRGCRDTALELGELGHDALTVDICRTACL